MLAGPDDEIAWETVEPAAPAAAKASTSDAAAGDTPAIDCTSQSTCVYALSVLSVLEMCHLMLLLLAYMAASYN